MRTALQTFHDLGADPWVQRAEQELRASGETARKRDASTSVALTAQEKQVAAFIAEGLSNRDVAAKLFLSPRTIDFHLRNVFAKTGYHLPRRTRQDPLVSGRRLIGAGRSRRFRRSVHVHACLTGRALGGHGQEGDRRGPAAIPAATESPENPVAAPAGVVRSPAAVATAASTATPSAAPISWPVIRNPDAIPACWAGMPAIAVIDTATKTRPTPSPSSRKPGRRSAANRASVGRSTRRTRRPRPPANPRPRRSSAGRGPADGPRAGFPR